MSATSRNVIRAFGLALILISAGAGSARAAAPNLMAYQGRIKESGLPVTGVRTVDIQICPALTGGVCATTGAQGVSVVNGLFRTTFTIPSGTTLESGAWFLEVHVGGAVFGPREMLSANAYAIYASSASTLIVNPGDSAVFIAPNVVIAGNGSIGGNNFSVGVSTFVVNGGSVGIGTASPGAALEVKGSVTLSGAGHLRASGAGAPPPAVSACGAAASIAGSDTVGRVTIGGGGSADCSIAFGTPWSPNPPVCHFTNESGNPQAYSNVVNATFMTFKTGVALTGGNVISYTCLSY